jgi:hypothetical protein
LNIRCVDGGFFANSQAGRTGRGVKLPPQFGQTPLSLLSTQSRQNVHSNVQIIASVADGGKSLSQHSQLGRSSSICHLSFGRPFSNYPKPRLGRFRNQVGIVAIFLLYNSLRLTFFIEAGVCDPQAVKATPMKNGGGKRRAV